MKKTIRLMVMLLAFLFASTLSVSLVRADYKPKPTSIKAVGAKKKTVRQGDEFELKVRMTPRRAEDDYLQWSIIKGNGVVRFEDDDREGDDVDLVAVKAGTAKVRCKIHGTKKSVTFTVTVKKSSKTIRAVTAKTKSVKAGQEFELKVRTSANVYEDDLLWSITKGKNVVAFEDDDIYDDEVDLVALKKGSAEVRCRIRGTNKSVTFKIKVGAASQTITAVGSTDRTVRVNREFELKVRATGVSDKYLEWSIEDESILMFEDGYPENDDEMEFIAIQEGTTAVTCTNTLTGKSVKFTVTVIG